MPTLTAAAPPPVAKPARPQAAMAPGRVLLYACVGLVVAIVCAYAGVVRCDFISLDDRGHIVENRLVTEGLTWPGIAGAFADPHAALWVPLTWISFMADVSLFGLNPGAMHAMNLAWHAASAVLLLLAFHRMTGQLWPSVAVAALWGLHPLNVESVAWVTERKNVLCAFFWMLALLAYARYAERPQPARYAAVFAACALALLAKPMAVTLPCALLLLDFWPLRRHLRVPIARLVLEKLPLLALALASSWMAMRAVAQSEESVSAEMLSIPVRLSNAAVSYAAYLRDLAWPAGLGVYYPHPLGVEPVLVGALALLAVITALAILWRRQRPYLLVGWLWFLGTLVPMIGLVQAGSQARADRFPYLAQIGVFIAIVWLVKDLRPAPQRTLAWLSGIILLALGVQTARQVLYWTDSVTLYTHTLAVTGPNPRVETLVANALAAQGDYAAALPHYDRAVRLFPDFAAPWNDFGAALLRLGRSVEAVNCYRQALRCDPHYATARYNLASALMKDGASTEAIEHLRVVIAQLPDFGRAHLHLGRLLLGHGAVAEARAHLRAAARLLPADAEAARALAEAEKAAS